MIKRLAAVVAAGVFAASMSTAAVAQGKKKTKAAPTCPVCNMALASKKDDKNPVAVKVGKKVMYCCSGCDMSAWKKDKKGNLIPPAPAKKKK
jgi:uncharacterized protein with PIN domain